jgi:hypothetical protein
MLSPGLQLRCPGRSEEPPLAIRRELYTGFAQRQAVPELAGDLAMTLVERLAVIGVQT